MPGSGAGVCGSMADGIGAAVWPKLGTMRDVPGMCVRGWPQSRHQRTAVLVRFGWWQRLGLGVVVGAVFALALVADQGVAAGEVASSTTAPPPASATAAPPPAEPSALSRPAQSACDAARCEVDACTRELLLQSPSTALNTLRVVPQAKDGQMTGMRLFGIRPTSVWAKLGLRNSDLVIAINGHALSNPTQALEAYSEVKDADRFTVELERAGVTQIRAYFVKKLPAGTDAAKACPELAAATGGESDALAAKPQPSTLSTSPVVRPADKLPPVVTKGIKCQGSKCTITRAALEAVLGDPSLTSRSARLVPTLLNGQVVGFKIFAVRPASLFALLGLLNGDLIRRISGFDLNSPERALEAYTKVRNAKTIPLELTRRGAEMTLTYVIGQ